MEQSMQHSSIYYQIRYSEEFKHQVCREYMTGQYTKSFLSQKYQIRGHSRILSWLKQLGYMKSTVEKESSPVKSEENQKDTTPRCSSESQEIKRLKKELEEKRLEAEMYARMVELAEEQLGLEKSEIPSHP